MLCGKHASGRSGSMNMPMILCGPMVRRVDRSTASIFLVLRESREVTLRVHAPDGSVAMSGTRCAVKVGDGLYAVTVTAAKRDALAWGETYHYDLALVDPNDPTKTERTLRDDDVLVPDSPSTHSALERLVYGAETLPSFALPPDDPAKLRILHGSCRKPHGLGRDALAQTDRRVDERSQERPHQLFLTGDQIYADDVHEELLPSLSKLAHESRGDRVHLVSGGARKAFVAEAGLTSGEADRHLLTLGEFYAMYLFVFSRVLWSGRPEAPELASFYDDLPHVRRLLANTATYMMFDDHEITDDWFISRVWTQRVLANSGGRRILRNGLIAYAIFQHWGNDPAQFAEGKPGGKLLGLIDGWTGGDESTVPAIEQCLGMPASAAELEREKTGAITWSYRWEGPMYEAIVLDTRTRRGFDTRGGMTLMGSQQIGKLLQTSKPPRFTLVVSPAPVLGLTRLDTMQGVLAKLGLANEIDDECWARSYGHELLVERLLDRSPVVVLSGDVHFGVSASLTDRNAASRRIVNFTSSALKNESVAWKNKLLGRVGGGSLEGMIVPKASADVGEHDELAVVDLVAKRAETVEIGGGQFEEALLVGDEEEREKVLVAAPPRALEPAVDVAVLEAVVPHQYTAATPGANVGEIRLEQGNGWSIVQRLFHVEGDEWAVREDKASFPLRKST
ncbi:hypothetical protein [Sorangium sp. So ce385]|uniref:hypothetical protein n=1 Tax=Sorangium sp. So ce385 TaxID=3133308 RepID=UPI003F5C5CE5